MVVVLWGWSALVVAVAALLVAALPAWRRSAAHRPTPKLALLLQTPNPHHSRGWAVSRTGNGAVPRWDASRRPLLVPLVSSHAGPPPVRSGLARPAAGPRAAADASGSAADEDGHPPPRTVKRKVALVCGFDGEGFHGSEIDPSTHPDPPTVGGTVWEALKAAGLVLETNMDSHHRVQFASSSRTDKGVSAARWVVTAKVEVLEGTFDESARSPWLCDRINQHLPPGVRVLAASRVSGGFRARHCCNWREYEYLMPRGEMTDAQIDAMDSTLRLFQGDHSWVNFCRFSKVAQRLSERVEMRTVNRAGADTHTGSHDEGAAGDADREDGTGGAGGDGGGEASARGGGVGKKMVGTLYHCHVDERALMINGRPYVRIRLVGQHFLQNTIRLIVGAAWAVSTGHLPQEAVRHMLEVGRRVSDVTSHQGAMYLMAPAEGLLLVDSGYDRDPRKAVATDDARARALLTPPLYVLMSADDCAVGDAFVQRLRNSMADRWSARDAKSNEDLSVYDSYVQRAGSFASDYDVDLERTLGELAAAWQQQQAAAAVAARTKRDRVVRALVPGGGAAGQEGAGRGGPVDLRRARQQLLPKKFSTALLSHCGIPPGQLATHVQRGLCVAIIQGRLPVTPDADVLLQYVDLVGVDALARDGSGVIDVGGAESPDPGGRTHASHAMVEEQDTTPYVATPSSLSSAVHTGASPLPPRAGPAAVLQHPPFAAVWAQRHPRRHHRGRFVQGGVSAGRRTLRPLHAHAAASGEGSLDGVKRIGTHSGAFHCDEALAVHMLKSLPEFEDAVWQRSRDLSILHSCEVVVDVGGEYDPARRRYDHHQRGFGETLDENHSTKLSSAGLVYKHHGRDVIRVLLSRLPARQDQTSSAADNLGDQDLEAVYQAVYTHFVEAIDAIDNGVHQYESELPPRYHVTTDVSSRVAKLNPPWDEPLPEGPNTNDPLFADAIRMVGSDFDEAVVYYGTSWLAARRVVRSAIQKRHDVHPCGELVRFDVRAPWKEHLHVLEKELGIDPCIKYALYPDTSGGWRVQAVPVSYSSFTSRVPLAPAWQGVRDHELDSVTGIDGCVFVHSSGFIGGNRTLEGAKEMALKSLEFSRKEKPQTAAPSSHPASGESSVEEAALKLLSEIRSGARGVEDLLGPLYSPGAKGLSAALQVPAGGQEEPSVAPECDMGPETSQHVKTTVSHVGPHDTYINPEPSDLYDLVIIGAGVAGLLSAISANALGKKVCMIEKQYMGGDCLNVGCFPSKALIASARAAHHARGAHELGVVLPEGQVTVDFPKAMERMRRLRAQIAPHDGVDRYSRDFCEHVLLGQASFVSGSAVQVEGVDKPINFRKCMVAVGAAAAVVPVPGLRDVPHLTNNNVFNLEELPPRTVVIGGGPIGVEMAQTLQRFGSQVTLIQSGPQILSHEDAAAGECVRSQLVSEGVTVHCGAKVSLVTRSGIDAADGAGGMYRAPWGQYGVKVLLGSGEEVELQAEALLTATGRVPNVYGLGLDKAGVGWDTKRGVHVNGMWQTANPNIYATGDCASAYKFTHAADWQARLAVRNMFVGDRSTEANLLVPWCTYSDPEVARVGRSEKELEEEGVAYKSYVRYLADVDRCKCEGVESGFVKITVQAGTDRIVGATIVGPHAGDMIAEITLCMTFGIGLQQLAGVMHPYPTTSEAVRQCAAMYWQQDMRDAVADRALQLLSEAHS